MGEVRNTYNILVGEPEETTRKPRRRWEDNIKINLRETRCGLDASGSG
jgi:hypothetical protein